MFILPVGGGGSGSSVEDLIKLQEFIARMSKEKEEEEKKKKEKDKKPPNKGMSTLEAVLLMTLLSPVIGPFVHWLYKGGFNYLSNATP